MYMCTVPFKPLRFKDVLFHMFKVSNGTTHVLGVLSGFLTRMYIFCCFSLPIEKMAGHHTQGVVCMYGSEDSDTQLRAVLYHDHHQTFTRTAAGRYQLAR